jgi:hypothetical protein
MAASPQSTVDRRCHPTGVEHRERKCPSRTFRRNRGRFEKAAANLLKHTTTLSMEKNFDSLWLEFCKYSRLRADSPVSRCNSDTASCGIT